MYKILVLGIALFYLAPANAEYTLYEADGSVMKVKGWADVRAVNTQDETEMVDGFSRLNFNFERELTDGWKGMVTMETGINLVGETDITFAGGDSFHTRTDDMLNLRLGYVGFEHPTYGRITFGKQWGAYYDLAGMTDWGHSWGGAASGAYNFNSDGGLSGTGRADQAVQYRNQWGGLSLALQYQLQGASDDIDIFEPPSQPGLQITEIEYEETAGATISYRFAERHLVSAAFNQGEFEGKLTVGGSIERDDQIAALGYQFGEYNTGLFLAAVYADAEYHEVDNINRIMPDSTGVEVFASYRGNSRFMPYILYNSLEADNSYEALYLGDEFHREFFALGAVYFWTEETEIYLDIRIDSSDMSDAQSVFEDDGVGIGVRYSF
jgi:predicted porin